MLPQYMALFICSFVSFVCPKKLFPCMLPRPLCGIFVVDAIVLLGPIVIVVVVVVMVVINVGPKNLNFKFGQNEVSNR